MDCLTTALHAVLGHALAALELEDRDEPQQSLLEYSNAWCTLSCALEVHAARTAPGDGGGLPSLVRETCAVLIETYSARHDALSARLRSLESSCDTCAPDDMGRPNRTNTSIPDVSPDLPNTTCQADGVSHPWPPAPNPTGTPCNTRGRDSTPAASDWNPQRPTTPADVSAIHIGGGCGSAGHKASHDDAADGGGGDGGGGGFVATSAPDGNNHEPVAANSADGGRVPATATLAFTDVMKDVLQQCQRPVAVDSSLDDLAGLEEVKDEVRMALLLPMQMPHLFAGIRKPARNFLLHGPPGTGKTMLVERIAAEAGATLLVLTPGCILSKWSGESEKQLRAVFDVARALQPCIVFMDEVDSLAPVRSGSDDPASRRLLNELLVHLSCLATEAEGGCGGGAEVYVFAATNRVEDCDPALLRRFDRRLAVPLPGLEAREAFLAAALDRPELAGHGLEVGDVRVLAERTEGYSGSDLAQLCREAAMQPVKELLQRMAASAKWGARAAGGKKRRAQGAMVGMFGGAEPITVVRPLLKQDFETALAAVKPVGG